MLPRLLFSYHYIRKHPAMKQAVLEILRRGLVEVLIDSGAFSAHRLGTEITIEEYCDLLAELRAAGPVWGAIQLDVIGNKELSRVNLKRMVELGAQPMPVLTSDAPVEDMAELVETNLQVCVAGGVSTFKGCADWVQQRYISAYEASGQRALIHGLGYVRWPEMLQLPLHSVDSSSFMAGGRYGQIWWFDRMTGTHVILYRDALTRARSSPIAAQAIEYARRCGIKREDWGQRGLTRDGLSAFSWMSSVFATCAMSLFVRRYNLRLFLAVSNIQWLRLIASSLEAGRPGMASFDYPYSKQRCDTAARDPIGVVDRLEAVSAKLDKESGMGRGIPSVAASA